MPSLASTLRAIAYAMFKTFPESFVVRDIQCPAQHGGHPCPPPFGLFPLAPPLRLYGAPKAQEQQQKQQQQQQKQKPLSPTPLPQVGEGRSYHQFRSGLPVLSICPIRAWVFSCCPSATKCSRSNLNNQSASTTAPRSILPPHNTVAILSAISKS